MKITNFLQTWLLSFINRFMSPKQVIILGLIFEAAQLILYGFCTEPLFLWIAGLVAAMGSITYPALSSFVSNHAAVDQQGVAQVFFFYKKINYILFLQLI